MLLTRWHIVTILSLGVCPLRFHHPLLPHLPFKRFTFPTTPSTLLFTMILARQMTHTTTSAPRRRHRSSKTLLPRPPTEPRLRNGPQTTPCPTLAVSWRPSQPRQSNLQPRSEKRERQGRWMSSRHSALLLLEGRGASKPPGRAARTASPAPNNRGEEVGRGRWKLEYSRTLIYSALHLQSLRVVI